jgi:hypothetical protein
MPFLKKSYPIIPNIHGAPVSVIAVFNTIADMKPVWICVETDQIYKVKIDAIKYIRDNHGVKRFCVLATMHSRQYELLLDYDIANHKWFIA